MVGTELGIIKPIGFGSLLPIFFSKIFPSNIDLYISPTFEIELPRLSSIIFALKPELRVSSKDL